MVDNEELLNNLQIDIKKLNKRVKHPRLYNMGITAKKSLLCIGMWATFSIPFIVGVTGAKHTTNALHMTVLELDKIPTYAEVGTTTTSNGYYMEERVFGENSSIGKSLVTSTKWEKNEDGLYERKEAILEITGLDLSNPDSIFEMDIEELKNKVNIISTSTITKEELTQEDEMYNEDIIIVNNHYTDGDDVRYLVESDMREAISVILYLFFAIGLSAFIRNNAKLIFKKLPSKRLKEKKDSYVYITEEEIEELKEIYRVKKQNLDLLTNDDIDCPTLRMMK